MRAPQDAAVGEQASAVEDFGLRPDGQRVSRIAISGQGLSAWVLTHGATLQDLRLAGFPQPLVLGFPTLGPYLAEGLYFGAIVGRYANRIAGGRARIGGRDHQLDRNFLGRHLLHGGADGTGVRNWRLGKVAADALDAGRLAGAPNPDVGREVGRPHGIEQRGARRRAGDVDRLAVHLTLSGG